MAFDPKLAFWTLAVVDFAGVVWLAWRGVARVRRGDVRGHRRRMLGAASLVALFLVAYLAKVALLGREDRSLWTPTSLAILYVHETCVAVMLLAGALALRRALRFRRRVGDALDVGVGSAGGRAEAPPERVAHRRAGRVAVAAATLGWLTSLAVLIGMYARGG